VRKLCPLLCRHRRACPRRPSWCKSQILARSAHPRRSTRMQPPLRSIWPHPQASWASCFDRCMHLPCRDRHMSLLLLFSGLQVSSLCSWICLRGPDTLEARAQSAQMRAAYGSNMQHQGTVQVKTAYKPTICQYATSFCSAALQRPCAITECAASHISSSEWVLRSYTCHDPKGVCKVPTWHGKAKSIAEMTTGSMLAGMQVAQLERTSSLF